MKRSKYFSTLILFLVSLVCFSIQTKSQDIYQKRIYRAFIDERRDDWGKILKSFEDNGPIKTIDQKLVCINYYYGIVSYLLEKGDTEQGIEYLGKGEKLIDQVLEEDASNASAYAYKGAFYGYRLSTDHSKAPILVPKVIFNIHKAYRLDSMNIQAIIDRANIYFYAPRFLGGDAKEAVRLYSKASLLMEQRGLAKENWFYFNLLVLLAEANFKAGNAVEARSVYLRILGMEPGFVMVKDRLLPALEKKIH